MWLIEEKAIILRKRVWFSPPIPPINVDKIEDTIKILIVWLKVTYVIKAIGAIFCTVKRTTHWIHGNPCITGISQKCKGAAPIFNKRDNKIIILGIDCIINIEVAPAIRTVDLRAWMRKYFKAASEENEFFFERIKGINDITFNSNPIQLVNQVGEEDAIITPRIRVNKKSKVEGFKKIKKRGCAS